jgi:DNA (cytosine-5)-methyltransferase 1
VSGLLVDSFAGGGGASLGIEMAMGRHVDIAINHDPEAIRMHLVNHPHTVHYQEDVWQVDPLAATGGQPVELFWLSPDCKHFSKAKGAKPRDSKIRGLAWLAVKWAKAVWPRVIILENVEEFRTWGPLNDDGMPCKKRKGQTFDLFIHALEKEGYNVEHRELVAADYGAPTSRKRLFMIARRDGKEVVWPEPTHGDPDSLEVRCGVKDPWRAVAEIIDWSIPCPSIFNRKRPLADATLRRIQRGMEKFGEERAFVVQYNGQSNALSVSAPLNTITAIDRFGVVTVHGKAHQIIDIGLRMLTPRELFRAQGFPDSYIIDVDAGGNKMTKKSQVARVGNSVVPQLAEALVRANVNQRDRKAGTA